MTQSTTPASSSPDSPPVLILGGGIAGLGAAWGLVRHGHRNHLILEKRPDIGGLLTTVEWEGCWVDLGPHRIHSQNPETLRTILDILGDEIVTVKRKSRMRLCGRFIDYPQKMTQVLAALGPARSAKVAGSFAAGLVKREDPGVDSMEHYFVSRFGRGLYEMVFAPYARKVWREDPSRLSANMSRDRVSSNSLLHTIKDTLFPKDETFLRQFPYPRHGIGTVPDRLWAKLEPEGARARLEVEVKSINLGNEGVESVDLLSFDGAETLPAQGVISTLPLPFLMGLLQPRPPREVREAALGLEYSSLVLVYVALDQDRMTDDTWLYFPEEHILFSRIYELANWSPTLVPRGRTCVCVEVPCRAGDERWTKEGKDTEREVVGELIDMGLIRPEKVRRTRSVKVPNIYPIYTLDYEDRLQTIFDYLRTVPNLLTTGRGGLFRHNNLDHALDTGIASGEHMAQNKSAREWYDGLHRFEGYRIVD